MAIYRWRWWFPTSREALWPRISDTDWINRHAGLPPVTYQFEPLSTGGSRARASTRMGPLTIRWIEPPFEWSRPEYYAIERRYLNGPLKLFKSRTALQEERGGTAVEFTVELRARSPLLNWMLPFIAWYGRMGADRALRAASQSSSKEPSPAIADVPQLFGRAQLQQAGFSEALLDRYAVFLESAEDRDLSKMRPYEIADRWGETRKTILNLFLTSTRIGLLNLKWDLLCGGCRGAPHSADTLQSIAAQAHCPSCNMGYGPEFDRSIEVTFNAHPLGKGLDVPTYCLIGPHMSRHVVAQEQIRAGASGSLAFAIEPGRYVAHAMSLAQLPFAVEKAEGVASVPVQIGASGVDGFPAIISASELACSLQNSLDHDVLLRIEVADWPDTIVTAADVTAMQEFRDLFSSEVLSSGLELSIQSMTVLFTDLVGSTEMYTKSGDAPAFRIVTDHFNEMRTIIAEYDGAIVKTIGDAVMAVFRDSGKCLEAALRLPAAVGTVECNGGKLQLRVGFHSGPCIAMSANERLDYFGTTVNLASRLEHAAAAFPSDRFAAR
ncbi:MAG: hypothetical protein NVSMB31_16360 [Vulcanimicrobiaceae bacterium]